MFRALGISIIAHLLVLSFFYERMVEQAATRDSGPTIQAEIKKTAVDSWDKSPNIDSQVVQPIERRKESRMAVKSASSLENVAVTNQAEISRKIEPLAAVNSVNEQHSENLSPEVRPISQDGLRQYGINVAREARKHKKFPSMARQRGWEGEVSVVIGTVAGSSLPLVSLSKGSGFDALDQAALEMVRAAVRDAQMPEELYGLAFALTLPIRFSLED